MDTLKNILKPGGNKDDEVMYGSDPNRGKVSGEGSHFPKHVHSDSGVEFSSGAAPVEHIKPSSGVIGASATQTADPGASEQRAFPLSSNTATGEAAAQPQPSSDWPLKDTSKRETDILEQRKDNADTTAESKEPTRASQVPGDLEGPVHNSKILNELDPRVKEQPGSATNRDITAGAATGAAAGATAGEAEHHDHKSHHHHHQAVSKADQQHDVMSTRADGSEPTRASQIPGDLEGPVHKSAILNELDPRVKAHPGSATTGGHHTLPKVGETHHGDAAAAIAAGAGAGAAGSVAVHEGDKFYDAPQSSDPTTTAGPGVPYRTLDPAADHLYANRSPATEPPNTAAGAPRFEAGEEASQQHPTGLAAGGATAAAAATTLHHHEQPATTTEPTTLKSADAVTAQSATTQPTTSEAVVRDNTKPKEEEHHAGRDAAIAGGAAGAGALGAHEFSKKEAEKQQEEAEKEAKEHEKEQKEAEKKAEKEHAAAVKQQEKEQKEAEKQHEKEVKEAEKQHAAAIKQQEKEQKEAEKQAEKEHAAVLKEQQKYQKEAEKQAEKQHAAEVKEQEKAEKAAQKQHEKELKEAEKQRKKEEKEEKPGFISRLLGRDKDSSDKDSSDKDSSDTHKHEAEGAAAGLAAGEAVHHHHETTGTDGLPTTPAAGSTTQPSVAASGAPTAASTTEPSTATAGHFGTVPPASEPNPSSATGGHFGTAAASEPASTTAGSAANTSSITGTAAATGAAAGIAAHEHEQQTSPATDIPARKSSIRNKLHKDPPAGYAEPPSKGYASQVTGGTGTTALAQGNETIPPPAQDVGAVGAGTSADVIPGTRYGSGRDEHVYHANDPSKGVKAIPTSTAGGTVASTVPYAPAPQSGYASQVTGGTGTTQLAQGDREPITNPKKDDPLNDAPKGYAAQVTGGTGTTALASGGLGDVQGLATAADGQATAADGQATAADGQAAASQTREAEVLPTETPYESAPEKGYASQVTGGTGTTQLARGDQDPVTNPSGKESLADKIKGALAMK